MRIIGPLMSSPQRQAAVPAFHVPRSQRCSNGIVWLTAVVPPSATFPGCFGTGSFGMRKALAPLLSWFRFLWQKVHSFG